MVSSLPPTLKGWPLLGNFPEYLRDHLGIFRRGYQELGPIFSIRLGPQRAVVLIGPVYHRFFFEEVDRTLSLPEVYRFVVPMFGRVLNAAEDEPTRKAHLALLHSAFRATRMPRYVDVMRREISDWLDALGDAGEFEMYETFAEVAMKIAASAFLGPEVRGRMPEFVSLFYDLARGMDFVLPPNLPLPRFRRRNEARRKLAEMIRPAIAERRARHDAGDDFLQNVLQADGTAPVNGTDETVVGLALLTVFTGYIATAAQTCWGLLLLLQNPQYLALVEAERERLLPARSDDISADSLHRLEVLERGLMEAQRLHPVMSHYARYNARAYDLGGYRIRAAG